MDRLKKKGTRHGLTCPFHSGDGVYMATAGFHPATVPDPTCSIPTERIQLFITSLLYCGSALRERGQAKQFQEKSTGPAPLLRIGH